MLDDTGIVVSDGVQFATLERALLDKVYLDGYEHFDNLMNVDWEKAKELNDLIYKSKKIQKYILDMENAE